MSVQRLNKGCVSMFVRSMQPVILKLLEQKVSETVRIVDDKTTAEIGNTWNEADPLTTCPLLAAIILNERGIQS